MGNVATRCRKIADLRHFHRLLQPGELSLELRFLRAELIMNYVEMADMTATKKATKNGEFLNPQPFLLVCWLWCPKKLWSIVSLNTPRLEVLDLFCFSCWGMLRVNTSWDILILGRWDQQSTLSVAWKYLEVLKTLSAMPPGASFQWHPQRASCAEVIGRNRLEGCWRKHLWLKSLQG